MSLYRQTGERGPTLLVTLLVTGLLIGAATGFLLGRDTAPDPSLAEQISEARAGLAPVAAALELVPIEYEGAVSNGQISARTEYEATQQAASRATNDLEASAQDLKAIDPTGYEEARESIKALEAAINAVAPQLRIEALATAASTQLKSLAGTQ